MAAQVAAYQESILELKKKVIPMGGFWWQLMDSSGALTVGMHPCREIFHPREQNYCFHARI